MIFEVIDGVGNPDSRPIKNGYKRNPDGTVRIRRTRHDKDYVELKQYDIGLTGEGVTIKLTDSIGRRCIIKEKYPKDFLMWMHIEYLSGEALKLEGIE